MAGMIDAKQYMLSKQQTLATNIWQWML